MEAEPKLSVRTPESLAHLRLFCNDLKETLGTSPTIVELGSFTGESSLVFAEEFPKGKIICIDPWQGGYDDKDSSSAANFLSVEAQFDLRMMAMDNVRKFKGYSTENSAACDMVYIDACHKYESVIADIMHWLPLTRKVIAGHDYCYNASPKRNPHLMGVKKAVDELLGKPDKVYGDGSWYKKFAK